MPNTLIYRTHDPEKVAERLEERVRADLGAQMAVPYEVHDSRQPGRVGALADLGRLMVHANLEASIATIVFSLPWHRPATLAVIATRYSFSSVCAFMAFQVDLAREIDAPIGFERKAFVAKAEAGVRSANRLQGIPGLARRLKAVLRDKEMIGGLLVEQPSEFSIVPTEDGARILIRTLARQSGMLIASGHTDAGEILSIARVIEGSL